MQPVSSPVTIPKTWNDLDQNKAVPNTARTLQTHPKDHKDRVSEVFAAPKGAGAHPIIALDPCPPHQRHQRLRWWEIGCKSAADQSRAARTGGSTDLRISSALVCTDCWSSLICWLKRLFAALSVLGSAEPFEQRTGWVNTSDGGIGHSEPIIQDARTISVR